MMSSFLTNFESTRNGDSKYYDMIQFINAANELIKARSEESSNFAKRHLHPLSVSSDYSIFDPNTSVVCEFFVSLHKLLTSLEPRSSLTWRCITVLYVACSNPSARSQLIHTYQFIPPVSRLLGDHLSTDKKEFLLKLMQELSCGIKISWQIPHLSSLISTLIQWIEADEQNEKITNLSLGVLVNLCYKNIPAVYTLSKFRDIKQFLKTCTSLKGSKLEANICKLLLILDHTHGIIPNEILLKLTNITFKSITEAFQARDFNELRHNVEFYLDIQNQHMKDDISNSNVFIGNNTNYLEELKKLMEVVDASGINTAGDLTQNELECMAIIFRFLHSFIELKLPKLTQLYYRFAELALRWTQTELISSEALSMLATIIKSPNLQEHGIMDLLLNALPTFSAELQIIDDVTIMNIDLCKRLCSLVQFLRALLLIEVTREPVLAVLNEQMICQIFVPLIGTSLPITKVEDANNGTPEAILLYTNTLVLLNELATYNLTWVSPLSTLLDHRQIHGVLAEALCNGTEEIRSLILCMAASSMFPHNQVAVAMYELQPLMKRAPKKFNTTSKQNNQICFPVMSPAQSDKLDETIHILKEAREQNNIVNIPISEVMELYEFKLASISHSERTAIASEEEASEQCAHLQEQTAQLTEENLRIRQLFIHKQQQFEELNKSNNSMVEHKRDLTNRLDAERGRYKVAQSQLHIKEKMVSEKERKLQELSKRLKERDDEKTNMEETNSNLKAVVYKLEENIKRQEKHFEAKDDVIKIANASIEHFKLQVVQLERQLKQTEMEMKSRVGELDRVKEELLEKSQLIDTITRLTTRNK